MQSKIKKDRTLCKNCWQPAFNCFCHEIEKFYPNIEFVILIHPIESRRRIATGRMAYLSLKNAHIIRGSEFGQCPIVNRLVHDDSYDNVILARGPNAIDITNMSETDKVMKFKSDKKLRIFLVDGTWSNAGKMLAKSPNLHNIPKICFTPNTPSNIKVRKQPSPLCYSTLEAIHHIIELLGTSQDFDISARTHDKLLKPFEWMVNQQLDRIKDKNWRTVTR